MFLEVFTRRMWSSIRRNGKFMGRDESGCDKNTFDLTQRYLMLLATTIDSLQHYYKIDVKFHIIISSFSETCSDFIEASPKSMYNCYKLLGFDVLVDNNLKVSNRISKIIELIIISIISLNVPKQSKYQPQYFQRCI